jgi:hypothetical protein
MSPNVCADNLPAEDIKRRNARIKHDIEDVDRPNVLTTFLVQSSNSSVKWEFEN